jgi:hypothetical protein
MKDNLKSRSISVERRPFFAAYDRELSGGYRLAWNLGLYDEGVIR